MHNSRAKSEPRLLAISVGTTFSGKTGMGDFELATKFRSNVRVETSKFELQLRSGRLAYFDDVKFL